MWSTARRPRESWELPLRLERTGRDPLFLQIARTIVDDICRGRLKPGDRLPGTRTLARSLGVNRITTLTAYDELAAEGWIAIRAASGARVSDELPELQPRTRLQARPRTVMPGNAGYPLPPAPIVEYSPEMFEGKLVFGGSSPDTRLVPVEPLARAYRRVLRHGRGRTLAYGHTAGHPSLRQALASMLSSTRGLACTPDHVFITRGSQMALSLVARALIRPGDVVAVEGIGYRHAWESFALAGADVVPVPVDSEGIDVDALETLASRQPIRAVYVTPHHQFPTTVTLGPRRRLKLLDLARRHAIAIVEDDYDHEFHYDGAPVLPVASADESGVVIYIGTLSKVLAPGLRIGYVVAPLELLARLEAYREFLDMQGDHAVEAAVAELIEDGEVQRHIRRARRQYKIRRDTLAGLLREHLGDAVSFHMPAGGIALWVEARSPIDVDRWARRALARGVAFQTARAFTFDRQPLPCARLGFASLDEDELRTAVGRLAAAL